MKATTPGGTSNGVAFTVLVAPTLTSISPTSGLVGSTVTLNGTNLSGATSVSFNGTTQTTISSNTATSLTVVIPAGSTSGNVTVTTPGGTSNGVAFMVLVAPTLTSISPTSGLVGSTVTLNGTNLTGASVITFAGTSNNTVTSGFAVNAAGTQITGIVVPSGAATGNVRATTLGGTSNGVTLTVLVTPTITSFTPTSSPVGTSVVIKGTNFTGATAVVFNGTAAGGYVVNSATQITVSVPGGATTGPITVTTPDGTATSATSFTVTPDLVVSTGTVASPTAVAAGIYNSITVTSTGVAQLTGATTANTSITVNGTLLTNCQPLTGSATFTLAAGATLGICDPQGLSSTAGQGAVQTTGLRSFSTDASYTYNGTAAQVTGAALPPQVRSLRTSNANAVTLSAPTRVAQVLMVGGTGNFVLNGNSLTLLSSAAGTALVVNGSTGVVSGTATVQRYTDGALNPGAGYRHFSAPVANTTVADLATAGFAPEVSQASVYNSSATPGTTPLFPTVFGYDQSRLISASNSNYAAFDKGFFVPAGLGTALVPGQGYAVHIGASPLVDFQGTLGNGDLTVALARNSGATAPDAGWALVGNPYPAPLDWSQVLLADRSNLNGAVYVVQSTGSYAGGYRAYVNGQSTTGTNNPLIASSQGFWVRVSAGNTAGSLTFRNSQRVTDYAAQQVFQRGSADPRPVLRLTLTGAGLADGWVTYAQAGATPGFDREYDAAKLPNGHGLNLSSTGSSPLAIDGRPAFTLATVLPLAVGVPTAGRYTLTATALANLPAGLTAYLYDAQTEQTLALTAGTSYAFSVTNAQVAAPLLGRFTVQFAPTAPLAATSAALAAAVSVYPNPAREQVTLAVPGLAGTSAVRVELLNALGQVVLRQQAALPASGTHLVLPTAGLATGVYVVRLLAGPLVVTKRLTLE